MRIRSILPELAFLHLVGSFRRQEEEEEEALKGAETSSSVARSGIE